MELVTKVAGAADALVPAAAVQQVASLVADLQARSVHDVYFPWARFGALHALRVSLGWAMATKGRRGRGLKDLAGFLVMACE